jgi:hypothetical protein
MTDADDVHRIVDEVLRAFSQLGDDAGNRLIAAIEEATMIFRRLADDDGVLAVIANGVAQVDDLDTQLAQRVAMMLSVSSALATAARADGSPIWESASEASRGD